MTKISSHESGRSMVEMLGVLAIIGVLSVGGIAGYSMAMTKFKTTKTIDQIQQLTTNIRSLLESQRYWPHITTTETFYNLGILTEENYDPTGKEGVNTFGGGISISTGTAAERNFTLTFTELPKDVCTKLASTDWGGDAGSGLEEMGINGNKHVWKATYDETTSLPIGLNAALTQCNDPNENTVYWVYK